jgi:flagellin
MNTNRQLGITGTGLSKSTEKLSSGYKINRAADDAAGLSISEKMRNQIRGLNKASDNAQDGISLVQTAEGALNEAHNMLQRMSELAVQASNDTNQSVDRAAISQEIGQLQTELQRIGSTTQFNKMNILDGSFTGKNLQVGANNYQTISISISALSKVVSAAIKGFSVDNLSDSKKGFSTAETAISKIQTAITSLSTLRSKLGAIQNRLEYTANNLDNISENTQSAESRIRDTDMAEEMVNYSKYSILQSAGQSMLAQANSQTQGVLSLLQ